jgi:predicted GNAT family N-acyltransferase
MYSTHSTLGEKTLPPAYFLVRYEVLRAPLGKALGTERLKDDNDALHVWITDEKDAVVSVGRAHTTDAEVALVQIRMMATHSQHVGKGLGRQVLTALEKLASQEMGARQGWLNARDNAVAFYARCGWATTNERFVIDGIGPHTRMTRDFTIDPRT